MIKNSWLLHCFFILTLLCGCAQQQRSITTTEKKIVVVIPSYNNSLWYKKNLDSAVKQRYNNFKIIYIDDCSTDNTGQLIEAYKQKNKINNLTIIHNRQRRGALYNHYHALHMCADDEIIVSLDGDDWFAHRDVLARINHEYCTKNIWLTYGQFQNWPQPTRGWCKQIPADIIDHNTFREFGFCTAQPRTYYAWLAKKIKKEDLLDTNGNFYSVAGDVALMFPMLEMAGNRFSFIDEILYIRNIQTPINDFKIHQQKQEQTTIAIRKKTKYQRLV
jgi:glycosyltransferase involved in cell wall biosynthesis